jgi:two-component system CheB/CheR fusion protein
VMFLDRALHIKRFTPQIQDLFNVVPHDVGRPLGDLTHRLEIDDLPQLAESVLETLQTIEREVSSRDGRRHVIRLRPYRSLEDRIDGVVVTFVDVTELRDAVDARRRTEAALETSEARLRLTLRTAPMLVIAQDEQLQMTWGYLGGKELAPDGEVAELFAPGHADRFAALAHRVLQTGGAERAELDLVLHGEHRTYDLRLARSDPGVHTVGFDVTPDARSETPRDPRASGRGPERGAVPAHIVAEDPDTNYSE